jgi:probable rRNA maturation factor
MVQIELFREGVTLPYKGVTRQKIIKIATAAAHLLELKNASITLILTDDAYMRNINREFRGLDEPTDVISFSNRDNPFPDVDADSEEIGDLYISLDKADRQAREYRVSLDDEIKRLVVHGMLHLVGYDHERSDADEEIMLQKEDELCDGIDV